MKTIKILLIAVLFIGAYSASAQWTDNGAYSSTPDDITIGSITHFAGDALSVQGGSWLNGTVWCDKLVPDTNDGRFDFGWGATMGSNMEFYSNTNAISPGQLRFVFGGNGFGNINYLHYTGSAWTSCLFVNHNGNVGLGTESPTSKLTVVGNISCSSITTSGALSCSSIASSGALSCTNLSSNGKITTKEVLVTATGWPDYVFNENYKLKPLSEVEQFVKENKHLPGISTAKEIEQNGLSLGEMNKQLMQKVEELTLYVIQLQKEVDALK